MDYLKKLQHHYKPQKGWINDPNGLVYYKGYYHVFYQHLPDSEVVGAPGERAMHWGHARTKNFIDWEELPIALYPDKEYDRNGCFSGTAIVKDDVLYLCYASIKIPDGETRLVQTVSIAYSKDGISFEKYEKNPVINNYPEDGGPDFRDPAMICVDGIYYCVMATGHPQTQKGRLLLYKSKNVLDWEYSGIMAQWDNCEFTECPSFVKQDDKYFLTTSVCPLNDERYFSIMYGTFKDGVFEEEITESIDRGPDQYAGQVFTDFKGRNILIAWIPGWKYEGFAQKDIGCMSIPRELFLKNGRIYAYPIEEVRCLLKDEDPAVKINDNGFVIEREGRENVVYRGEITDLKILRDEYVVEVFVNGGEAIYTAIL